MNMGKYLIGHGGILLNTSYFPSLKRVISLTPQIPQRFQMIQCLIPLNVRNALVRLVYAITNYYNLLMIRDCDKGTGDLREKGIQNDEDFAIDPTPFGYLLNSRRFF